MTLNLELNTVVENQENLFKRNLYATNILNQEKSEKELFCLRIATIIGDNVYLEYDRIEELPLRIMNIEQAKKKYPKLFQEYQIHKDDNSRIPRYYNNKTYH